MAEGVCRKLTTIFHVDVSGYSRPMEQDEVGTLRTLKDYRERMSGLVGRHGGRVINATGDSMLADFDSVVEAVNCATEVQRELAERNRAQQ